jgi:hypothetical protein
VSDVVLTRLSSAGSPPPSGQPLRRTHDEPPHSRSSGRKCRAERAQISGRAGANVRSSCAKIEPSGRNSRAERAQQSSRAGATVEPRAQMYGRAAANVRVSRLGDRPRIPAATRRCVCAQSTGHIYPIAHAILPGRRGITTHSSRHFYPLEQGFLPPRRGRVNACGCGAPG